MKGVKTKAHSLDASCKRLETREQSLWKFITFRAAMDPTKCVPNLTEVTTSYPSELVITRDNM